MKSKDYLSVQDQYSECLFEHLEKNVYASGTELRELLAATFNLLDANARQAVSRAARALVIRSSSPFTFGHGQFIYLYNEQGLNVAMVMRISKDSRPPLYRLLKVMLDNGSIISYYEAMKVTASPGSGASTKVETIDDMLKVLKKLNLVYLQEDGRGVSYILFKEHMNSGRELVAANEIPALIENHYAKMVLDASLIPDILRWLYQANLIDNNRTIYRNKKTPGTARVHNKLTWDAFSYTKATGINPSLGAVSDELEKQTLVVLDVVLSGPYTQEQLDGFLARVQINLHAVRTGHRKVMPLIFYRECEERVLGRIRKMGLIAFEIGAVFGQRIYEVLSKLQAVNELLAAGGDMGSSVKSMLKTIRNAGQDDALKDLKGTLFECLMYPLLKSLYGEASMERGKTLVTKGIKDAEGKYETEQYEYDYIIHSGHPRELVFVELKGYMSNVVIPLGDRDKKNSLKWFFERTVPFGATHYQKEISENRRLRAVFITTARFDEEGELFIAEKNEGRLKSANAATAYERYDLLKLLQEQGFAKELKIIEKYYTAAEHKKEKKKAPQKITEEPQKVNARDFIGDVLDELGDRDVLPW